MRTKSSIFVILLTVFIDAIGVGLVYPMSSPLIFDTGPHALLPLNTTVAARGAILGFLMSSFTIGQFLSSPIMGTFSDLKGRKKVVSLTLCISIISYFLGAWSLSIYSVTLLIFSRFLSGFAAGNSAVMHAAMADLSESDQRAKRFGWMGASVGIGFIMGPMMGAELSTGNWGYGYQTPFLASAIIGGLNLILVHFLFSETIVKSSSVKINLWIGLSHLKKAVHMRHLRPVFSAMFMYFFGWELFIVFVPVYTVDRFHFSPTDIGLFYSYVGGWFVLSNALLMRFTAKFSAVNVLKVAFPLWGLSMFVLGFVNDPKLFWYAVAPLPGIGAIIYSTGSALVSNLSEKHVQGESMGIYQSVQAAALAFPPLVVGSIVTVYPYFPIVGGSVCLFIATIIWWTIGSKKLPANIA
ncbi:MAG: MFS transporter [Parachlamydiales bacterium]|nr:MFS transporter [Parachlamydiales bacterium]